MFGALSLHVVKGIDEVGAELQFEPLRDGKVFVHAEVNIGVMRAAKSTELGSASAKCSESWVGEIAIVGEPLEATGRSVGNWRFAVNGRDRVAVGARAATRTFRNCPHAP